MSASCTPIRRKQSLGVYFLMEMMYFLPLGAVWMISLFIVVTNVMFDVSMVVLMVGFCETGFVVERFTCRCKVILWEGVETGGLGEIFGAAACGTFESWNLGAGLDVDPGVMRLNLGWTASLEGVTS